MKVNGIQFKRITDKFENHKPIWDDVNRYFGTVDLMDANKEEELESILGFNIKKLINEKAHKKIQVIK